MRHLEKLLASLIVIFASVVVYAEKAFAVDENVIRHQNHNTNPTHFSLRDEQIDREETIYLLTGAETDEEEARILETRLEAVRNNIQTTNPDCERY